MDIHEINNNYNAQSSSPSKVQKDKGFKQVFDRKLTEINAAALQSPADCTGDVLEKSDKILYLLDDYARELSDPEKSLRDIEPLVERISKEVSLIEAEAAEKVHNDSELERFIKDLAVTANVAVLKFHRGDYI